VIAGGIRSPLVLALGLCGLYLAGMTWFLWGHSYILAELLFLFPLGMLMVYQAVFHFERYLYLMVFFIPLSMNIRDLGGGLGASFPVEPMLLLAALIAGGTLLRRSFISREVLRHPVTVIIGLQLVWIVATALASSMPLFSIKFFAARVAYLLVFFFLFAYLFQETQRIVRFVWMYLLGLAPVLVWSLYRLAGWGLARSHSPDMAEPFFDDHTVLGACLAMLLPAAVLFFWQKRQILAGIARRGWIMVIAPLTLVSLALTFSRAAWLSVIAALGMYLLLRLRVPFRWLTGMLFVLAALVWLNQDAVQEQLRSNKTDSGEDVLATAASVTNVSTDESNRERVNRWSSALRMHEERPWMGWGPGTYERNYGIFQISTEKTRISTMDGDRGDAHSEYLGVLAEQGIPGLVLQVGLFLALLWAGMRATYRAEDARMRNLAMVVTCGLVSYFIHGGVNSFLDLDKAASLFWAMAAMTVALHLESGSKKRELGEENRLST
jgi:O-antigen ligase